MPGLLIFYQFAKLEVKIKYHKVIKKRLFGLMSPEFKDPKKEDKKDTKKESKIKVVYEWNALSDKIGVFLIPLTNAFISSMILGYEDQNEDAQKGIEEIMQLFERAVGTRKLYSAVWVCILRSSKIRTAALKYINKSIPLTYEGLPFKRIYYNINPILISNMEKITPEDYKVSNDPNDTKIATKEDLETHFYPDKSSLVVNALIECILDTESEGTQRGVLDFLNSHMKLNGDLLKNEEKGSLVEHSLKILLKKNEIVKRKLYMWILGGQKEDQSQIFNSEVNTNIMILVLALQNTFKAKPKDKESSLAPLKLIEQILKDHPDLTETLISEMATSIVGYFLQHWSGYIYSEELKGSAGKFWNNFKSHSSLIWRAMGSMLSSSLGNNNIKDAMQSMDLIKFFLINFKNESDDEIISSFIPILSRLLRAIVQLSNNFTVFDNCSQCISLIKEIVKIFSNKKEVISNEEIIKEVDQFFQYYTSFMNKLTTHQITNQKQAIVGDLASYLKQTINLMHVLYELFPTSNLQCITALIENILKCQNNEYILICAEEIIQIKINKTKSNNFTLISEKFASKVNEIIQKLWIMLDKTDLDKKLIDILVNYEIEYAEQLCDIVTNDMQIGPVQQKVEAISRFGHFWKQAGKYHPNHKVLENDRKCLSNMVDFLSNDHPLIRYSAKHWITNCILRLDIVLDPILESLINLTSKNVTCQMEKYQVEYKNSDLDVRLIIHGFQQLQSILAAVKSEMLSYCFKNVLTDKIKKCLKNDEILVKFENKIDTYLKLMLFISLKYILGVSHLQNDTFCNEIVAVKASSSEFLEAILTSLEPKNCRPILAQEIIEPIMQHLYYQNNSFEIKSKEKDKVMQVEMLKILNIVLFQCNISENEKFYDIYQKNCLNIFCHPCFLEILAGGLCSDSSFVRSYYISFTSDSLDLFDQMISIDKLSKIIKEIYIYICSFLENCNPAKLNKYKSVDKLKMSMIEHDQIIITDQNSIVELLSLIKCVFQHYVLIDEKKKYSDDVLNKIRRISDDLLRNYKIAALGLFNVWKILDKFCQSNSEITQIGVKVSQIQIKEKYLLKNETDEAKVLIEECLDIITPIITRHTEAIVFSYLDLWCESAKADKINEQYKILQTLLLSDVHPGNVIQAVTHYTAMWNKDIVKSNKEKVQIQYDIAVNQANICKFIYLYISNSNEWFKAQEDQKKEDGKKVHPTRDDIKGIWTDILLLIKTLLKRKYPSTVIWVHDIMSLLVNKLDSDELYANVKAFRNDILNRLRKITIITSDLMVKKFNAYCESKFRINFPICPSVISKIESKGIVEQIELKSYANLQQLLLKTWSGEQEAHINTPIKEEKPSNDILGSKCMSYLILMVHYSIPSFMNMLQWHMLKEKKNDFYKIIIDNLIPIIESHDLLLLDSSLDILILLTLNKDQYAYFKRDIFSLIKSPNFFSYNSLSHKNALGKWKTIISKLLEYDKMEFLNDLIKRLNDTSIFQSKKSECIQKWNNWKRIAFIIYCGKPDLFADQYLPIMSKSLEDLKSAESPDIIIQIFLLLRVMFIRFSLLNKSNRETAKNLQTLYPNILNRIKSIFIEFDPKNESNIPLVHSAMKFLEMLSYINAEDYTLCQWIFFCDSFGYKLKDPTLQDISKLKNDQIQLFLPYVLKIIPTSLEIYLGESTNSRLEEDVCSRRLVFVNDIEQLFELTQLIRNYIFYSCLKNVSRTIEDEKIVSENIEKDFIVKEPTFS